MRNQKLIWFILGVLVLGVLLWNFAPRSVLDGSKAPPTVLLNDGDTYDLTASYIAKRVGSDMYRMLAYNGTIPGPTIRASQGSEITIRFKNETDMPALLHSHGVRMDNAYDGSQLQQKEIMPGESFEYKLRFVDPGVYWYHPHVNEVYGQALGLYGAFVVEPKDSAYYPPVNSEHVMFVSDLPVTNGQIGVAKDDKDHSLMGHYGNVMLVNGESDYVLPLVKGEVARLYLINSANTRPFNVAIRGTKLKLVGGDGGAYERATWQESVILGPSERAIVDVMFDRTGAYEIENRTPEGTTTLGMIKVGKGALSTSHTKEFGMLSENMAVVSSIDPFRQFFGKTPDKRIALSIDLSGMMAGHMRSMDGMNGMQGMQMGGHGDDGIEWNPSGQMMQMMNMMATTKETIWKITDVETGKSNMDINWVFQKNVPVKIEIYNDPKSMHPMQHPIHFHGQRFLVLSTNGVPTKNLVWKDTVLVPVGVTMEILLDPSNVGAWMAHCHISEHLEAGMMFTFEVR